MSDTIKTTIEFGGIVMKCNGRGTIAVEHLRNALIVYNSDYQISSFTYSPFDLPFYIECKEDPSKLHKFCEMKYHGLVDNPNYDIAVDRLREMVKKFDGCLVHKNYQTKTSYLVTRENVYSIGCNTGVLQVLGCMLIEIPAPRGDQMAGSAFFRIDASKMPDTWLFEPSYNNDIISMCNKLKDVEL